MAQLCNIMNPHVGKRFRSAKLSNLYMLREGKSDGWIIQQEYEAMDPTSRTPGKFNQ